jgi:predicted amidophosphoribosyltransferase
MFRKFLALALDSVVDRNCLGCAEPARDYFCDACSPGLMAPDRPQWHVPEGMFLAPFQYGGPLAEAIKRAKYGDDSLACIDLGLFLARELGPLIRQCSPEASCAVPLQRRKLRERGYNVPGLILRSFASALALPIDWHLLTRVRDTAVQASLPRVDRFENMRGAFQVSEHSYSSVLVLDDVVTTGATLRAAMGAFRGARGGSIVGVALAQTALP